MTPSAARALLRIELRHMSRHIGRSLLIVLLVAIPTAAMVGGAALMSTVKWTVEDQRHEALGLADAVVVESDELALETALGFMPEGLESAVTHAGIATLRSPGRKLRGRHFAVAPGAVARGGLLSTKIRMESGRAPSGAGEVALSPRLLHGLAAEVGDSVRLNDAPAIITGVVAVPADLTLPAILTDLALAPRDAARALFVRGLEGAAIDEVRVQLSAAAPGAVNALRLRKDTGSEDALEALIIFVFGSFGFFEAALVIGAAFAVGMRRRQRELGLVASTGAERRPLVGALLISTAGLSLVGALIGALVGYGAARLTYPHLNDWNGRDVGAFTLPARFVVLSCALGVGASILSAWLPARAAARLPILVALSGRRPVERGSLGFLRAGAALVTVGALTVGSAAFFRGQVSGLAIVIGAIVFVLGLGALSPWMLERLARLAAPLPIPWRLALRDAGRFRARNGPVVTAVIAGMSISVLMGCLVESVDVLRGERSPALGANELRVEGDSARAVADSLVTDFGGTLRESDQPGGLVVTLDGSVTVAIARSAVDTAAAYPGASVSASVLDERPELDFFHVVLWVCILTGLIVIFVATALSSEESAQDARVLHTVGAAPGLLRHHMAARAGYLALLGCVLAVPAGLVPMIGLLRLSGGTLPFVMPWSTVWIAILLMPLIAYAGTFSYALARPPGRA